MRRHPRRQERQPLPGPGAGPAGGAPPLPRDRQRRGSGAEASPRPRLQLHVGRLPGRDRLLRHRGFAVLRARARRQRRRRALGKPAVGAVLPDHRGVAPGADRIRRLVQHPLAGRPSSLPDTRPGQGRPAADQGLGRMNDPAACLITVMQYSPNVNFGLAIENILPVPGKGILITGWLWDPAERLEQLLLVDAQGYRKPIQAPMHRYDICQRFKARPTDEPLGFLTFQPCAAAHDLWPTYQVKGMLKDGRVIDLSCCLKASRRALSEPENLLRQLPADKLDGPLLRDLTPTIGYLQARNEQLALYRQFWNYDRVAKEDVRGASLPRPRVDGPMLTARPRGVAVGAVGRGPSLADAAGRQANTTPAQGRPPMKRACRGQ